ncbi:hypothetical protein HBI47_043940 [Parastagonospora nodorum]|nr:hypothetical protein HBI47_043940 [Parastagonospora nodorum]
MQCSHIHTGGTESLLFRLMYALHMESSVARGAIPDFDLRYHSLSRYLRTPCCWCAHKPC